MAAVAGWISRRNLLQLGVVTAAGVAGAALAVSFQDSDDAPSDGTKVTVGRLEVFVVDRTPDGPSSGTVLFLHGASFTSSVWDRTGLLDAVTSSGWRAVAVDLPGHGQTPASDVDPPRFLQQLMSVVASRPVLVAPSASGRYALPVVASAPELVAGFVPVAPVGLDRFRMEPGRTPPPSLVVWGTDDDVISPDLEPAFVEQLHGTAAPISGAGHSPYDDHPKEFRRRLEGFLTSLR